jgi:SAM-dependent methyltransferase
MVLKIASLAAQQDRVFSIGCGNGFVEADLIARGLHVQAIDCNTEAVALAASKGVDAFAADYFALPQGHLSSFGVVYADGLLGHLYRADGKLHAFFETLAALKPRPGCWLVFSNDAPLEAGVEVAPHARVSDFWLLSKEYLAKALSEVGCQNWESYHFPYFRPVSGLRNRTICVARVAEGPLARS